jgi:hypothetical protein
MKKLTKKFILLTDQFRSVLYLDDYVLFPSPTFYNLINLTNNRLTDILNCVTDNAISTTGFFSISNDSDYSPHVYWSTPASNATLVDGFFSGCTASKALLQSTLDCLYNIQCIELLINYFPALNQVKLIVVLIFSYLFMV